MNELRVGKLHERLAVQLAREVVAGRMKPSSAIPSEPELVDRFEVSKTVVREAVQALANAGLVRVQQGKRTTVLEEEAWNVLNPVVEEAYRAEGLADELIPELYEVRGLLEPEAARLNAERANPGELNALVRIVEAMKSAAEADRREEFLTLDRDFHLAIATGTGNRVLRAIIRDVHELVLTRWLFTTVSGQQARTVFEQHERIIRAIASRDPDAAQQAMRDHIRWASDADYAAAAARRLAGLNESTGA